MTIKAHKGHIEREHKRHNSHSFVFLVGKKWKKITRLFSLIAEAYTSNKPLKITSLDVCGIIRSNRCEVRYNLKPFHGPAEQTKATFSDCENPYDVIPYRPIRTAFRGNWNRRGPSSDS